MDKYKQLIKRLIESIKSLYLLEQEMLYIAASSAGDDLDDLIEINRDLMMLDDLRLQQKALMMLLKGEDDG